MVCLEGDSQIESHPDKPRPTKQRPTATTTGLDWIGLDRGYAAGVWVVGINVVMHFVLRV